MAIKRLQGEWERRHGVYYEYDSNLPSLGEGGMGVVYLGKRVFEQSGSYTYVAIKQLRDNLKQEVYQRAVREASIKIRHENLVEMFGFITDVENDPFDGTVTRHYVISEYLHGVLLSDVLSGNCNDIYGNEIQAAKNLYQKLNVERANTSAAIIRCILSGIQALHDKGFIHRDIDPTNIMITSDGNVKLIDFGIAKDVNSLGTSDKLVTVSGEFVGKPEYAAPELVLGDIRNQGFHTDIYAVGILMFQLLAGRLPFEGSRFEIFQKQLKSQVPLKMIDHAGFRKVIRKATEKNPTKRYASAAEFRVVLDSKIKPDFPDIVRIAKYSAAVIVAAVAVVVAVKCFQKPNDKEEVIDDNEVVHDADSIRFCDALEKFNSVDPADVAAGYAVIKNMADIGYAPALKWIGMMSFPKLELLEPEISNHLESKRKDLGIVSGYDQTDYEQTVIYLSASADDVLSKYMLGFSLWRLKRFSDAIEALQFAKDNYNVSQGQGVPYDEICHRLDLCQKQDNKKNH